MKTILIWIGGIALALACVTDVLAVAGRHVGIPVRGSIEFVQACVLVAGGIALILATDSWSHARVHIFADRMSPRWKNRLNRSSALLGAVLTLAFLSGCLWIASDLWNGQEVSELLHIPFRLLRIICNLCLILALAAWLRHTFGRARP